MGMRKDNYCLIISIQHSIEHYSKEWITKNDPKDYQLYLDYVGKLVALKLQILKHEQQYGWNN
jgi:hypothetical protein